MRAYAIEYIGTFFLMFTIGMVSQNLVVHHSPGTPFAALAIGLMLTALVYMGHHISGAQYNPAVTVAVWMLGKMPGREAIIFIAVQLLATWSAAALHFWFFDLAIPTAQPIAGFDFNLKPLLLETIFTFILVLIILKVAMAEATRGNSYYGIAIGFTVAAGVMMLGPITSAVFNPAVAFGPMVFTWLHTGVWPSLLWLYLVGPFAGGLLASLVYRLTNEVE